MTGALIECLYAAPEMSLKIGDKLLDLSVDLSSVFSQDCPPISYYRVVLRERAWLRQLKVALGDQCDVGSLIAIFSSEADEPDDGSISRSIRLTTAGIIYHTGMWSGSER